MTGVALSLSSVPEVLAHIRTAHDVAFGAYFVKPGSLRNALTSAARHGAHVAVTLQADPYRNPDGAQANADTARLLRDAGAQVTLLPSQRVPFHIKAAVCDGVAYLDDRNFTPGGPEMVVRDDDPNDVALVRDALRGHGGDDATLATRKDAALASELALVEKAGTAPVVMETERVGTSPLTRALQQRAAAGLPTTLVVAQGPHDSRTERSALAQLTHDGVDVRYSGRNEKLALAGDAAWIGSGNATGAAGRGAYQLEWGLVTRDPALVGAVRAALARDAA